MPTLFQILIIPVLAFLLHRYFQPRLSSSLPVHLLGHPVKFFPALLDPQTRAELMNLTRSLGEIPGVSSAESSYTMTYEHIGEGYLYPASPNGSCTHPLLVPSSNKSMCVLPGRIDVLKHYVSTGGYEGLKEQQSQLVNRVQSFIRYLFSPLDFAVTSRLFQDDGFLAAARSVCPSHRPVLDPFQTTLIAQVPGQTVPTHLDGVWFYGANRFHIPQWLLAVMAFSDLFSDRFIPQVQLVAYFHEWEDERGARGGEFVHWADGNEASLAPRPGSASAMDGSKTIHAAKLFESTAAAPWMDKSVRHSLVHRQNSSGSDGDGGDGGRHTWELVSGGVPRGVQGEMWGEEQLRFSVVYRARCFGSEDDRASFLAALAAKEGLMDLESDILAPLMREVVRRGEAPSLQGLQSLPRLELALKLLEVFVKYPKPAFSIPNYCALPRLFPQSVLLARVIDWLCPLK